MTLAAVDPATGSLSALGVLDGPDFVQTAALDASAHRLYFVGAQRIPNGLLPFSLYAIDTQTGQGREIGRVDNGIAMLLADNVTGELLAVDASAPMALARIDPATAAMTTLGALAPGNHHDGHDAVLVAGHGPATMFWIPSDANGTDLLQGVDARDASVVSTRPAPPGPATGHLAYDPARDAFDMLAQAKDGVRLVTIPREGGAARSIPVNDTQVAPWASALDPASGALSYVLAQGDDLPLRTRCVDDGRLLSEATVPSALAALAFEPGARQEDRCGAPPVQTAPTQASPKTPGPGTWGIVAAVALAAGLVRRR